MKKTSNRSESAISSVRDSEKLNNDWFSSFEKELTKQAVKSKKEDDSLFNRINNIIGNTRNSKYKTVDDKIKEMQERSGYSSYSSNDYSNTKLADKEEVKKNSKPQLLIQYPNIELTINNYIEDTSGNQPLPAILNHVRSIHKKDTNDDSLWDAEDLIKFIDKLNRAAVKNIDDSDGNRNLGRLDRQDRKDVDPSNHDAFHALMPVRR